MTGTEFSKQEVLAAAFAAYRVNENKYLKDTYRYSEPENFTQFANKDLVKFHFLPGIAPNDFKKLDIRSEDYDAVNDALAHFKTYTFKILADQLSNFQKEAFAAIQGETVDKSKLGLVAYIPELVHRELKESAFKKLLRTEYHNSEHVGKLNEAVDGNVKILDRSYSKKWETNNYIADYMGNVVSFMKQDILKEGERYNIKAKVKAHSRNRTFDVNETRLNYVKIKNQG